MRRFAELLLSVALAGGIPAHLMAAESVACHLNYGGEIKTIEAMPTANPYTVAPIEVGSYTLFRIVFRNEPADLASIKLYTYGNYDDSRPLVHQATYTYPPVAARSDGFTGIQRVYEPRYGLELEYWCEVRKVFAK